MKKGNKKIDQKSKKIHCIILTCFTKQRTVLLNLLMIIILKIELHFKLKKDITLRF